MSKTLLLAADFLFCLIEFSLKVLYYVLIFACRLCSYFTGFMLRVIPWMCALVSFVLSLMITLFLGLLGCADKATNTLSWLMVCCLAYLYLDQTYTLPFPEIRNNVREFVRRLQSRIPSWQAVPALARNELPENRTAGSQNAENQQNANNSQMEQEYESRTLEDQNLRNENNANAQEEALGRAPLPRTVPSADLSHASPSNLAVDPHGEGLGPRTQHREAVGPRTQHSEPSGPLSQQSVSGSAFLEDPISLCIVCLDRPRSVAVFPCGHTHLCLPCASTIQQNSGQCPSCREVIADYRVVYL